MDKIFEKSNDLHVVATKIYKKADDIYAYSDSAKTTKIPAAELKELFLKGAVIIDGTATYIPTGFELASSIGRITYVTADETTATTAVLATLVSEEYFAG